MSDDDDDDGMELGNDLLGRTRPWLRRTRRNREVEAEAESRVDEDADGELALDDDS